MRKLDPKKLYVEFRSGVTSLEPILGRRYTLTHSDITGDLFLTIGLDYAFDKVNEIRDDVLAEWQNTHDCMYFYVSVLVDGPLGWASAAVRNYIFRRELPLALEAIRFGDRSFFIAHSGLDSAPIKIRFNSKNKYFNRFENWGILNEYK